MPQSGVAHTKMLSRSIEYGSSKSSDTYRRNDNEERLVNKISLSEQTETQVDEDEILAELRQGSKHVFACSLCSLAHVVVCIMLQCDTAEQ